MSNSEGKALFEKGLEDSDIEDYLSLLKEFCLMAE